MDASCTIHRILIVDDHETNRDILATQLTTQGYDLCQATDGQEALKRCQHVLISLAKVRIIFFARFRFESDDRGILAARPPSRSNSATADEYRKPLPQLHIHRSAAQTRIVSAAQFWPSLRKFIA